MLKTCADDIKFLNEKHIYTCKCENMESHRAFIKYINKSFKYLLHSMSFLYKKFVITILIENHTVF